MSDFGDITVEDAYDERDELIRQHRAPKSGPIWLTQMADILRLVGLNVIEYDGWQTRARGSGGYGDWPLCVMWHHTASGANSDGWNDASYIATGHPDSPISNLYIDRSGSVWVIAAGATNTNGKGKSIAFSRGTVPADGMNSRALGVECGNNGVGEFWPEAQINAMFRVNIAMNLWFGNRVDDLSTHNFYAPDRKIDPATDNVGGNWIPNVVNSSRSWDVNDVRNECVRRLDAFLNDNPPIPPHPNPPPIEDDDMSTFLLRNRESGQIVLLAYDGAGVTATGMSGDDLDTYAERFGNWLDTDPTVFDDFINKSNEQR